MSALNQKTLLCELEPFITNSKTVLEIGYSDLTPWICKQKPKTHTLIEGDSSLVAKVQGLKQLELRHGTWQSLLGENDCFDVILCREKKERELTIHPSRESLGTAILSLQEGKALLSSIEQQLPQLQMRYRDEDLHSFLQECGASQTEEISYFLNYLQNRDQITKEQHAIFSKQYLQNETDQISLIQTCLEKHLNSGGILLCLSENTLSKYEDPRYFAAVITNSTVEFTETPLQLDHDHLLITIKKLSK